MKITKLGHSCVLIETEDRVALFDPGGWATAFDIDAIERLDRIVITHEHGDHMDVDKIKALMQKFPDAHIVSNESIRSMLEDVGIEAMYREEMQCCVPFEAPHEKLPVPGAKAPDENGYHFKDLFTSPGDSHSFSETKKVLAMPVIAPWGKTGDAVDKILELKPEYVLPIHDWHYTPEAREWLQGLLEAALEGSGVTLLSAEPGITHEIPS